MEIVRQVIAWVQFLGHKKRIQLPFLNSVVEKLPVEVGRKTMI